MNPMFVWVRENGGCAICTRRSLYQGLMLNKKQLKVEFVLKFMSIFEAQDKICSNPSQG